MTAPLLAALAAVAGVWGGWEILVVVEGLAPAQAVGRVLAPLRLAGRAGRVPTVPERRRLVVLGAATLLASGWLVAGPVAGVILGAAAPTAVARVVAARRRRWRRGLAADLPDVARALADALAGGHSVRGGLQELARAGALRGPAGEAVRSAARRLDLGEPTEDVLEGLRRQAGDPGWDALAAAILLQREAGGDLAGLLRAVAGSRERARRAEADATNLTAQARATARLVAGLPFAGLALSELAAPGTLAALIGEPRSRALLLAGLALGALALRTVGRLARVGEAGA